MKNNFSDRLLRAVGEKKTPCIVGLDPRLELIPRFLIEKFGHEQENAALRKIIRSFNEIVIDAVKKRIPAVKLQIAFFEQYGIPGMLAFEDTIQLAKEANLIVIVDAKRNDIDSTAFAYARAFLGKSEFRGKRVPSFDVDAITVSPFLGEDSLTPFVDVCKEEGKGVFVLVKTSNPGSADFQDAALKSGDKLYHHVASRVDRLGKDIVGDLGYSSIGAVVGATHPGEAADLRRRMPGAVILVPGYGTQGGSGDTVKPNFNDDGFGAIVSASRSVTYNFDPESVDRAAVAKSIESAVTSMIADISISTKTKNGAVA